MFSTEPSPTTVLTLCIALYKGRCIVGRIAAYACGRRIGVISAITRQIGGIAADYERHNAFLVFIQMRPTRGRRIMSFIVGRNAADYEPTFNVVHYKSLPYFECENGSPQWFVNKKK